MQIFYKILILATLSLLGWLLSLATINLLIFTDVIQTESAANNFGEQMMQKTVFVWILSVGLGIVSLFIKQKWRYILLLCPLVCASIFAIIYSLSS